MLLYDPRLSWLRTSLKWVAIAAGGPSAIALLASLAGIEAHPLIVAVQSAAGVAMTAAFVATAIALAIGSTHLARIGIVVFASWAALGFSGTLSAHSAADPNASVELTVVSANLLFTNTGYDEVAATLDATDADVLITVETTATWEHQLVTRWQGRWSPVAHGTSRMGPDAVIWMRREPVETGTMQFADLVLPYVTVATPHGDVTVVAVHTEAPTTSTGLGLWQDELVAIGDWAQNNTGPVVFAGDFNAGLETPSLRAATGTLADAGQASGIWWDATWPRHLGDDWPWATPPVLTIDHVLVSDDITVVSYDSAVIPGSDHDLLIAELSIND